MFSCFAFRIFCLGIDECFKQCSVVVVWFVTREREVPKALCVLEFLLLTVVTLFIYKRGTSTLAKICTNSIAL